MFKNKKPKSQVVQKLGGKPKDTLAGSRFDGRVDAGRTY